MNPIQNAFYLSRPCIEVKDFVKDLEPNTFITFLDVETEDFDMQSRFLTNNIYSSDPIVYPKIVSMAWRTYKILSFDSKKQMVWKLQNNKYYIVYCETFVECSKAKFCKLSLDDRKTKGRHLRNILDELINDLCINIDKNVLDTKKVILAGYNIYFDFNCIQANWELLNNKFSPLIREWNPFSRPESFGVLCVQNFYSCLFNLKRWIRLRDIVEQFGIESSANDWHNAEFDTFLTVRVFQELVKLSAMLDFKKIVFGNASFLFIE